MYSVEASKRTQKFLSSLDKTVRERVEERLRKLGEVPIPSDAKFIGRDNESKIFRYRIGDFRALYKVKDKEKIVLVAKLDKRPRIYHRQ